MTRVQLAHGRLWVGETAVPLLSGEVHYWRLDPANWRPVLERARALGLRSIATYVCWDFCELRPGVYDFTGESDPRRNLLGFVQLAAELGLWVILRPGPYIYSEWRNNGVPDDAARRHRLHPDFQARAQPYMEAVTAAVLPLLASRGGPIVMWQADNEIDPWPQWHTEQLGLGRAPGPFHTFLQERYGELAALNAAWEAEYGAWTDARAVMALTPSEPDFLRRYLDTVRFTHWYVNGVARWAVGAYRALGVDVPMVLNAYSGTATQRWADLEALGDLAGPDIYPSQDFALRANEHRSFLEAVRYTRTYSRAPYIPEFEAGIWHGWHADVGAPGPRHYRLAGLSALLAGATGWNWYMLANRDNWYLSPLNEWGRARPDLLAAFEQLTQLYTELDPPSLTKLTGFAVTHEALQRGTTRPGQELLQALYAAGLDYDFFSLNHGGPSRPLLFYAGGPWLAAAGQAALRAYAEAGGHLVLLGQYPRYDDALRPHNGLGIAPPAGLTSGQPDGLHLALHLPGGPVQAASPWAYAYDEVPGEPIVAERRPLPPSTSEELDLLANLQVGGREVVGYQQRLGAGRLTVLGLQPSPALVRAVLRAAGITPPLMVRTPGVSAALFARGAERYVMVVNPGPQPLTAALEPARAALPAGRYAVQDRLTGARSTLDWEAGAPLLADLGAYDGTVLHLRPL